MLDEARPIGVEPEPERGLGGPGTANRLLAALPASVREAFMPSVRVLAHAPGSTLFDPEDRADTLVFPAEGTVLSLLVAMPDAKPVETLTVGSEGAVGAIFGPVPVPAMVQANVLVGGRALHLPAQPFWAAVAASPEAQALMARHAGAVLGNLHQAIACAALHPVEARASRWILTLHDRIDMRAAVPMTQEILADRLGVRRTTITRVVAQLEAKGAIQHRRGRVHVLDRAALEATACPCFAAQRRRLAALHPEAGTASPPRQAALREA